MPCCSIDVRHAALCAISLSCAPVAFADPASYVFVPYAAEGKLQLAYGIGTEHGRDGGRNTQQTLSLGGTPTARWTTSVYAAWAATDGGKYAPDEWTWINHLKLTAPGFGPADLGLLCELAKPHDTSKGTGLACGPTLQMDTDDLQVNVNLAFGKQFHVDEPQPTQLGYQWQVKGLLTKGLELGAQGFGSLGTWNHWSPAPQQEHTLGPAIFAKTSLAGFPISVDAAWLFGIGSGSPKNVLRLRVQQEF
jgi:hypothetical protein